jgi:hypothetical protein
VQARKVTVATPSLENGQARRSTKNQVTLSPSSTCTHQSCLFADIDEIPSYHACSNDGDYRGAPRVVTTVDTAHGRCGKQQYAQSEWGMYPCPYPRHRYIPLAYCEDLMQMLHIIPHALGSAMWCSFAGLEPTGCVLLRLLPPYKTTHTPPIQAIKTHF